MRWWPGNFEKGDVHVHHIAIGAPFLPELDGAVVAAQRLGDVDPSPDAQVAARAGARGGRIKSVLPLGPQIAYDIEVAGREIQLHHWL